MLGGLAVGPCRNISRAWDTRIAGASAPRWQLRRCWFPEVAPDVPFFECAVNGSTPSVRLDYPRSRLAMREKCARKAEDVSVSTHRKVCQGGGIAHPFASGRYEGLAEFEPQYSGFARTTRSWTPTSHSPKRRTFASACNSHDRTEPWRPDQPMLRLGPLRTNARPEKKGRSKNAMAPASVRQRRWVGNSLT